MKPNLILIAHGHFAEQAQKSAEMVMGAIDGLYAISMLESDGLDGTTKKLQAVLEKIGAQTPAIIAADMVAGTPCNVAVRAMYERDNIRIVTGLNLPIIMEYAVADEENLDAMANFLREVGTEAVKVLEKPQASDGEDGYEDS